VRRLGVICGAPRRRGRESGQATVEFALILFPMLIVVAGIIYFGIGLNYWLDMNRIANQGARFAAVNNWPAQCPRPATTQPSTYCDDIEANCTATLAANSMATLQEVLRCSARNNPLVEICYPGKTPATVTAGDPVKVKLTAPYTFFFISKARITLTASATIRLEQRPIYITGADADGVCP
jgi:Flp pilus assembly protein TadG